MRLKNREVKGSVEVTTSFLLAFWMVWFFFFLLKELHYTISHKSKGRIEYLHSLVLGLFQRRNKTLDIQGGGKEKGSSNNQCFLQKGHT